jgi:hypothetical protein
VARYKQTDAESLQQDLAREVTRDAAIMAHQIFSKPEPDVMRVSDEDIDQRYTLAFRTNDRVYLMREAQRDPQQFMKSMQRLGVTMPPNKSVEIPLPLPRAADPRAPLPEVPPSVLPNAAPVPPAPQAGPPVPPLAPAAAPAPY